MAIKNLLLTMSLLFLAGLLVLPLGGCREEGPGERMGRGVDEAAEEIGDAAEDVLDNARRRDGR